MNYLSICAIFRDEAAYLAEWVTFHRLCGVEHFFLYDNDSTDDPLSVLAPWIDQGVVTYIPMPGSRPQYRAYEHCLETHGHQSRWIAFIDIDEFVYAPDQRPISATLETLEDAPGVGVNWVMFGTSGHDARPEGLVTTAYQLRGPTGMWVAEQNLIKPGTMGRSEEDFYGICQHIKSIVDPSRVDGVWTPHSFHYKDGGRAVSPDGTPIDGTSCNAFSEHFVGAPLTLNHYWTKSRSEFSTKLARVRADNGKRYAERMSWMKEALMNGIHDTKILPLAEKVAAELGVPFAPGGEGYWTATLQDASARLKALQLAQQAASRA